jgi:hypothetical protein
MWPKASFFVTLTYAALAHAMPLIEFRATSTVGFAADPTINAKGILSALQKPTNATVAATFPDTSGTKVQIFEEGDLIEGEGKIFSFVSVMNVDCDGVDVSLIFTTRKVQLTDPFEPPVQLPGSCYTRQSWHD